MPMQIYDVLHQDHVKVTALLQRLVSLKEDQAEARHDLIDQIRGDLIPHSRAEESVFYNSLRQIDAAKDIAMHGYQEHLEAETLLRMLQVRDRIDTEWKATAKKLQDALAHHIREEEGKIFSVARQLFTAEEAQMMAEAFESLKAEVKTESFMQTTVDLVTNMMPPRFAEAFRMNSLDKKSNQAMSKNP
jgi:hemerythrin superfamily protein